MTFKIAESDFYRYSDRLNTDEKNALTSLREMLDAQVRPIANDYWERGEFPTQLIGPLAEAGCFSFAWPETAPFSNSAVFRGFVALELARVDPSIATFVGVQNGLVCGSIGLCGSPEQRTEWLPRLASGATVGAFALTEPLSGSDVARGLRTTATREGDTWVLGGQKRWIGNGTFADITVVWAKDTASGQVTGFLVPTDSPGYRAEKIEHKVSLRTVQNADIFLDGVRVPERLRLQNGMSFADTTRVLRRTRLDVAWAAVGIAVGAYEAARSYALERNQFGATIASHQLIQDLLVRCLGNITASLGMVVRTAELLDRDELGDEHASLAKSYSTRLTRETVAMAREILGGNGILLDYDVARFFCDAEAAYSYEGSYEINTLIVGRAVTGHAAFI